MINYSLIIRKEHPGDSESSEKVYAQAQYTTVMTVYELAKHIADHNSKYNRADVLGVILSLVDCMKELLLDGKRIRLGDLGTFYIQIKCNGADSVDDFTTDDITDVVAKWKCGDGLKGLREQAEFNYAGRRKAQQQNLEQERESLRNAMGTSSQSGSNGSGSSSEGESSSSGNGSSSGDNSDEDDAG